MNWPIQITFAALLAASTGGCKGHVQLTAPTASAPIEDRIAAYEKLKGVEVHRTDVYVDGQYNDTTVDWLKLGDGTKVYHPEDLLPIVPPDSTTATAAQEADSDLAASAGWLWLFFGSIVGGSAVALSPAVITDLDYMGPTLWIGTGIIAVGGILGGVLWIVKRMDGNEQASTAYDAYDESLRKRLNLCVEGAVVFGCEIGLSCDPPCRAGYRCAAGQCVSKCNPPCPAGQICVGEGAQATCQLAPGPRR